MRFRISMVWLALAILIFQCLTNARGLEFAEGQIVVEFAPALVLLQPNPGRKYIPLEDVPFANPQLKDALMQLEIQEFEILARHWRWIPPTTTNSQRHEFERTAPLLRSFRDTYVLHFPSHLQLDEMVEAMGSLSQVLAVGRNPIMSLANHWPIDTLLHKSEDDSRNYQWNFKNTGGGIRGVECDAETDIGLQGAYALQESCTVKIGLLDTGIDSDHPELEGNLDTVLGRNFTGDPSDSLDWGAGGDYLYHGTATAGIMAAIHDSLGTIGICGLRPVDHSVVVPMKIWPYDYELDHGVLSTHLIDALSYASEHAAEIPILVIEATLLYHDENPSGDVLTDEEVSLQQDAVYNTFQAGTFLCAAAGNDQPGQHHGNLYPAGFRRMVAGVAAIGCDGSQEDEFYQGRNVALTAPGQADSSNSGAGRPQIVTTKTGGGYHLDDGDLFGGTSAAVPHVGGVAALLLSFRPELTNEDIRAILQHTATDIDDSGWDVRTGHGLLRADSALVACDAPYQLTHDSTSTIDSWALVGSGCELRRFRNITIPSVQVISSWDTLRCDLYEFSTTVALDNNTNASHVPILWTRGRECLAARDTTSYDGHFDPNHAGVAIVSATSATLRGYAYKIYLDAASPCDSLLGWFPLNPTVPSMATKFSFSYLADTTSARQESASVPGLQQLRIEEVSGFRGGGAIGLRYRNPTAASGMLDLIDVSGRVVRRIALEHQAVGWNHVTWNLVTDTGVKASNGVYWGQVRLNSGERGRLRLLIVR